MNPQAECPGLRSPHDAGAPLADFNPNHPRNGAAGEGAVVDVMRMMEEEDAAATTNG